MKPNLKDKIKQGKVVLGSWLQIANITIAEIMAKSGLEWVAVDMEHSSIDLKDIEPLVSVMAANGCAPLVRLPYNYPMLAKRIMDVGACGIIVPVVDSAEDAAKAVSSIKYPPLGTRGVGLYRAQEFGSTFKDYFKNNNDDSLVIVQIEQKEGVDNIEEIVKVPGVDGVFIGPYDLSCSMGVPGELEHPLVLEAREKVEKAAKKAGLALGIHVVHPSLADLRAKLDKGYQFVAYSTDAILLNHYFREAVGAVKS